MLNPAGGVELLVCTKVLQVKPDDALRTMPVALGDTNLKWSAHLFPTGCKFGLGLAHFAHVIGSGACLRCGLGSNGDLGWLCLPSRPLLIHDD